MLCLEKGHGQCAGLAQNAIHRTTALRPMRLRLDGRQLSVSTLSCLFMAVTVESENATVPEMTRARLQDRGNTKRLSLLLVTGGSAIL